MELDISPEMMWAIGLFEGEGCISIRGNYNSVRLQISMTDKDVLSRFARIVESKVSGPYVNGGNTKNKLVWKCNIQDATTVQKLLNLWLPYLGERRREKAELALSRLSKNIRLNKLTHCSRGHEFNAVNRYVYPDGTLGYCKICAKINARYHRNQRKLI